MAAGLISGATAVGVVVAVGALVGALADRPGAYPLRVRQIALAGAGAAIGLVAGAAVHGGGWPAVVVLVVLAGLSALLSSVSVTWSLTAFCLLVFAILGTGPLGALQPWWLPAPLLMAGVAWSLLLLAPEWSLRFRNVLILLPEWALQSRIIERARAQAADHSRQPPPKPAPEAESRGRAGRRLVASLREARLTFSAVSGVRLMLCIAVAAVVTDVLSFGRSYWVVLAVAVVMKPEFGSIFARALQYAAGTVVGAVIGALIVAAGPPEALLLLPVLALAALLLLGLNRNYWLFALFLTPLVILLIDTLSGSGLALAEGRLIDILLGCAIVLGIGYAPWPWTWHAHLPRIFARAVDGAADYLDSTLPTSGDASMAAAQARAHQDLAVLRVEFRRAMSEPDPERGRVMAWSPAADALERVLDAVTASRASGAEPPSPAEVALLNEALRDIAAAARSGRPAPQEQTLATSPPLDYVTESVQSLSQALDGGFVR